MKTISLFVVAAVALSSNAMAASAAGSASTSSSASVEASRSGASASQASSGAMSAGSKHTQADMAGSSEMSATLTKPVDARKAKPGDPVMATTDKDSKVADGTSIRQGSKLVGHVTAARPLDKSAAGSTKGDSALSIVFDKAILKGGREVPLNATIQALAAAESDGSLAPAMAESGASMAGSGAGSARAAGGGLLGGVGGGVAGGLSAAGGVAGGVGRGVGGTVGGMAGAAVHSTGAVGGLSSNGALTSGSKGVFGMRGLDIAAASAGSAEGSVISSPTHNVQLDGGTRLLLSNTASASSQPAAQPQSSQ